MATAGPLTCCFSKGVIFIGFSMLTLLLTGLSCRRPRGTTHPRLAPEGRGVKRSSETIGGHLTDPEVVAAEARPVAKFGEGPEPVPGIARPRGVAPEGFP